MSSSKKHHDSPSRSSHEGRSQAKRVLRESIQQRWVGLDGLHAARFQLVRLFARIQRMHESIDDAFAGRPFLPDIAPNAPVSSMHT